MITPPQLQPRDGFLYAASFSADEMAFLEDLRKTGDLRAEIAMCRAQINRLTNEQREIELKRKTDSEAERELVEVRRVRGDENKTIMTWKKKDLHTEIRRYTNLLADLESKQHVLQGGDGSPASERARAILDAIAEIDALTLDTGEDS